MADLVTTLLDEFTQGSKRACGRLATLIENEDPAAPEVLHAIYPRTGRACRVGVTGPPGAGKSTIVEKLALALLAGNARVSIVAVDPSSPFSGGAILGDRIRMGSLFTAEQVFIRSMATRGSLGGLAARTREVCDLLDAFGCDYLLVETIGVGQAELDIAQAAHTRVVVLVPESGDAIQALKAGLMEIADLFVVNKADRTGADQAALEITQVLEMRPAADRWQPRVLKTVATRGEGIPELVDEIKAHWRFLTEHGLIGARRRAQVRAEVVELIEEGLRRTFWQDRRRTSWIDTQVEEIIAGRATPYSVAHDLLSRQRPSGRPGE